MRTLFLLLAIAGLSAVDAGPNAPVLQYAKVEPSPLTGYLLLSRPHQVRGSDSLLLPLARLLWIEDHDVPKGSGSERRLSLVFDYEPRLTLVFNDDTASKPAEVIAAIAAAQAR